MTSILADLNQEQQKVVQAVHGPVLVLAGAGSGKTRALTYRIAYLVSKKIAKPSEILAVTFTNKAAGEMKDRVAALLVGQGAAPSAIGTFHSLGARMLREHVEYLPRSKGFSIFDMDDSLRVVKLATDELNFSRKEYSPIKIRYRISDAKNKFLGLEEAVNMGRPDDEVMAAIWARYEKILTKNDAYDFDDLLIRPVELLERHANVREKLRRRWRWLSVDEYQDTNPVQDKLLKLLTGHEKNICVVGDDYQAIYSWRGANVDHILHFEEEYTSCQVFYLTRNYRSVPPILDAANQVIAENRKQKHKKLWTERRGGEQVKVLTIPSGRAEAAWVREQVEDHVTADGKRKDCVILYRTNAQSRLFEEEFLTHGIPYTIVGGFRFYERREIKDALAFLQFWVNRNSMIALQRMADALWKGVGPKTLSRWDVVATKEKKQLGEVIMDKHDDVKVIRPVVTAFEKAAQRQFETVSDLLSFLLKRTGYTKWLSSQVDGEERMENIDELLNVTAAYDSVEKFLEEVALLSDIDTYEEVKDRVTCMTLHAAKGLEFPFVIVVGCEDGLLPHSNSLDSTKELEEERRLLYVGMTRAKDRLVLTHAKTRYMHGDNAPQIPSRFLKSLTDNVVMDEIKWADKYKDREKLSDLKDWLEEEDDGEPKLVSFEEGDIITHKSFGRGVVIGVKGSAVTCVFERHGVRTVDGELAEQGQ